MSQANPADFTGIVVAAGRAERFGGPLPKQVLTINGRWVVEHSVDALAGHGPTALVDARGSLVAIAELDPSGMQLRRVFPAAADAEPEPASDGASHGVPDADPSG